MDRRGVSPVIAVLLLIVIAVTAAVLTYLWVLGYMGTLQQQGGTQQLQEKIKIEAVNETTVFVRNIGDVSVTVDAIYVLNASGVIARSTGLGTTIDPGLVQSLSLPTVSFEDGVTYIVKVVTEKGTEATYTFTYRS